jgi:hypothetical protein
MNMADAIFILMRLFAGGAAPPEPCLADPNDDGEMNLADGIYILYHLFAGGPAPAACCGGDD